MMYGQKAPWGRRIAALLLDGIFLNLIGYLALLVFGVDVYALVLLFGMLLYYGILEGSGMHATLGKSICGLIVVDEAGEPITCSRSFLRALFRYVSGFVFGVGYFVAFADPRGRTWHDKWAGTFVVLRQFAPVSAPTAEQPQLERRSFPVSTAQLVGVSGLHAGRAFSIPTQGLLIGRDPTSCDVVFPDNQAGVSRSHCKVQFNPQTCTVVLHDLGSHYGTFQGSGIQVRQGQPVALRNGDEFYLAARSVAFRVVIGQ